MQVLRKWFRIGKALNIVLSDKYLTEATDTNYSSKSFYLLWRPIVQSWIVVNLILRPCAQTQSTLRNAEIQKYKKNNNALLEIENFKCIF